MKILHVCHSPAFALRFALPIMDFIRAQGLEAELWVDCPQREQNLLKELGTIASFRRSSLTLNFFSWPFIVFKLYQDIRTYKPTHLHCHSTRGSLLPLIAGFFARVPVRIYNNHGFPYLGHRGILRFLLLALERLNIFFSTKIISVSESNRSEFIKDTCCPPEKIVLLHKGSAIGIRLEDFPLAPKAPGRFTFLYIGRPFKRKGFPLMVEAWAKGEFAKKGARLLIAGCSQEELEKLGLPSEGVEALGFVSDIVNLMHNSDVVVLPSFHEGLPYALLEAQALGKAVLGSNIPGIRSVIEDKKTGLLFELSSLESFIKALRELFENQNLREKLGTQARQRVEEDFDQKKVFQALLQIYKDQR